MRIYIEKTTQDYDQVPIPVTVHQAVRCMEAISEEARKIKENDSIWQFRATNGNKTIYLRPHMELNIRASLQFPSGGHSSRKTDSRSSPARG